MREYVWAIGEGATLEEADRNAMKILTNYAVQITSSTDIVTTMIDHHATKSVKDITSSISNMYLDNVAREVLSNDKKQKSVLRYLTRADWEARHDALKIKIEEYIESGKYATLVEDRIRYYTWAHILLQTYPNTAKPIKVNGTPANQWLHQQIRNILNKIEISVIGIEQDNNNRNYPYKIYLDFVYENEPISYLRFGYFDGSNRVESESVKDGRSIIWHKFLEPEITIDIDCLSKDLARQIEPSVALLLENDQFDPSFAEGHIKVQTKKQKPAKKVDTTSPKIESKVNELLVKNQAEYVEIKGMGVNETDLRIHLHKLQDKANETNFENCVADVNIPVGEVFTSPVLEGTNGVLHVSKVFLNELEYQNLRMEFQDGMIVGYGCTNFESQADNEKYIKDNVLFRHDTLPMGEFAIGTNTTAYVVAQKYQIGHKLPILIAEKMGPHFAVGDTCYSHQEDVKMFNPDGKEVIARDNEVSLLRHTDRSKAYFNCHTDITIPYDELGSIVAVCEDGREISIIEQGRFVLPGCEMLNKPFKE